MAKYKLFNVAAHKDKDGIFFNYMVELIDKNNIADLDELKKCIADVFSTDNDAEFSFRIVEERNPPSKKMYLDEDVRFSQGGIVNFKEELSAIGIILEANSEQFKTGKLVTVSFDYVVRTGTGYKVSITNDSKKNIGKYTANFIYSEELPLSG